MTPEQKGSIVFAIGLLAQALANDERVSVTLAQTQLDALFPRRNDEGRPKRGRPSESGPTRTR